MSKMPYPLTKEIYFTKVYFNEYKNGFIELVFRSSIFVSMGAKVMLSDLDSLKRISKQINDIIKEIENE